MMIVKDACLTTLASLGLVLSLGTSARAFTFVEIANTNTSGFTSIDSVVYSINDSGSVAFSADIGGQSGIFSGNGGMIDTIVDPSEGFADFTFVDINTAETTVFTADGNDAIFSAEGGVISSVIDIPSSLGLLGFTADGFPPFREPFINESGTIAFTARNAGLGGIFITDGGVFTTIAEPPNFDTFRSSLNNNGEVGFFATSPLAPDGDAVFIGDGTGLPTPLADPLGFGTIEGPSLNDAGMVVFDALFLDDTGMALQGIFTQSVGGDPELLVDTSTGFSAFDRQAINNLETIVFDAVLDLGSGGIFAGPDPVADRVIGGGDILFGSTITGANFTHQTGLNNQGQFAFVAQFEDGSTGIFRADPDDSDTQSVPEPMSILGLFLIGATGVVSRLRGSIKSMSH